MKRPNSIMTTHCSWANQVRIYAIPWSEEPILSTLRKKIAGGQLTSRQTIISLSKRPMVSWIKRISLAIVMAPFLCLPLSGTRDKALATSEAKKLKQLTPAALKQQRPAQLDGRWVLVDGIGDCLCLCDEWHINGDNIVEHAWALDRWHQDGEHLGYRVDNRMTPPTIEIQFLDHPDFPFGLHGIYKVEGDLLTVCVCPSIMARPCGFEQIHKGCSLLHFRRKVEQP